MPHHHNRHSLKKTVPIFFLSGSMKRKSIEDKAVQCGVCRYSIFIVVFIQESLLTKKQVTQLYNNCSNKLLVMMGIILLTTWLWVWLLYANHQTIKKRRLRRVAESKRSKRVSLLNKIKKGSRSLSTSTRQRSGRDDDDDEWICA